MKFDRDKHWWMVPVAIWSAVVAFLYVMANGLNGPMQNSGPPLTEEEQRAAAAMPIGPDDRPPPDDPRVQ